ncbi:hypothetical protein OG413_38515 [Streptomyces sp. NBC_01433]|nr:hypothetical protein [Streptomyces sp. NBC_01433]
MSSASVSRSGLEQCSNWITHLRMRRTGGRPSLGPVLRHRDSGSTEGRVERLRALLAELPLPRLEGGRVPKHGPEFSFAKPETWPEPAVTTATDTVNYGKAEAQARDRINPILVDEEQVEARSAGVHCPGHRPDPARVGRAPALKGLQPLLYLFGLTGPVLLG